jgi:hypothetical protein
VHPFYIENGAEIFPANYTWKVAEKGIKIAFDDEQTCDDYFF